MTTTDQQIAGLKVLRDFVVESRRTSVTSTDDREARILHIIQCQEALAAIDQAIADETRRLSADSIGIDVFPGGEDEMPLRDHFEDD